MANNTQQTIQDALIFPLPLLLTQTAQAVAEAQLALDETSMRLQQELDLLSAEAQAEAGEAPAGLARFQIDATWYHIPEVEVNLRMSLSMEVREQVSSGGKKVFRPKLLSIPHNARSKNLTNFEAGGTSTIKARIVSIPPAQRTV